MTSPAHTGYPLLRRQTPAVQAFNEAWWDEIANGSRRDQLSFDYVARRCGLRYATFAGTISSNPWFRRGPHVEPRRPPEELFHAARATGAAAHYYSARRGARRRKTVAFDNVRHFPSWHWVGFEVGRELSKDYDVVLFDRTASPPPCDVLFLIKQRPCAEFVAAARAQGTALVYSPIDVYEAPQDIAADGDLLRSFAMLLVHCERPLPLLRPYCGATHYVEHHTRYALPEPADYKADGFLLWIGHLQYVPYLLHWLEEHPLDREVRILTDLNNENGWRRARANAAQIGLPLPASRSPAMIGPCPAFQWSERRQQEMMRACKAALDVKYTALFSQQHKPPTKAQQFVASGIPCAINPQAYSAEYFRRRGFDPAAPTEMERWLSREYWEATRQAAARLRHETSIEAVAARYRQLIDTL